MRRVSTEVDRSRNGYLVHGATSSGRGVRVEVYIEGLLGDDPRYVQEATLTCRTAEQATEIARVLREAKTAHGSEGA